MSNRVVRENNYEGPYPNGLPAALRSSYALARVLAAHEEERRGRADETAAAAAMRAAARFSASGAASINAERARVDEIYRAQLAAWMAAASPEQLAAERARERAARDRARSRSRSRSRSRRRRAEERGARGGGRKSQTRTNRKRKV